VQSVGWVPKDLPFCRTDNAIAHFRHALALDERRVKFVPSFYQSGKPKHSHSSSECQQTTSMDQISNSKIQRTGSFLDPECFRSAMLEPETDVKEVFFAGAHCGTI
jgi:uncharacterized protein (DUF2235 family)